MSDVSDSVGACVPAWLRREWPNHTVKRSADAFGVSPNTTAKWLTGDPPANKHLNAMVKRWGKAFIAEFYEPIVGPWRGYSLEDEFHEIGRRIIDMTEGRQ